MRINLNLSLICFSILFMGCKAAMSGNSIEEVAIPISPTFTPNGGLYNSDIHVLLSSESQNARIYYSIDGSEPNTDSLFYTNPIPVLGNDSSVVIKAISVNENNLASVCSVSEYYIYYPQIDWPSYIPKSFTSESSIAVTTLFQDSNIEIQCSENDAVIYYSTDSSIPTSQSAIYTTPIPLIGDMSYLTINALSVKEGFSNSLVRKGSFKIKYPKEKGVEISCYTGIIVTLESISKMKDGEKYTINIEYSIYNPSYTQTIFEGMFQLYNSIDTGLRCPQYGSFGDLLPGETQTLQYTFQDVSFDVDVIEFICDFQDSNNIFNPIWQIQDL